MPHFSRTALFTLIALLLAPVLASPLHAAQTTIVAVVNDEAVTNADINDRLNLVFLSSGLQDDAENRKRVADRVLRNLIDEQLQMQEAKRYDIVVEQKEVDRALGIVAKQNGMTADQLEAFMRERSVPRETLTNQIKANLSWSKVVQRVLRSQVEVGDDEVNVVLERIKANEGKPEYLMNEIFLSVENPSDEEKIRDLANNLIERMKQGTPFTALAQQFSQGTGAINGGDMGWVQPGQLSGELDKAVVNLSVGQVSLPIRTADGFYILAKREERIISAVDPKAAQVRLRQASMPLQGRSLEQAKSSIDLFKAAAPNCSALNNATTQFSEWSTQDLGTKRVGDLPGWLAKLTQGQAVDQPSVPMEKEGYAMLLYVCERNENGSDRASLANTIGTEKLDLQARRLLRDLRRAASIDIRGT